MSDNLRTLLDNSGRGDFKSLARLLTKTEELGPELLKFSELLNPKSLAFRIGITGPPGAGKSTLINALISEYRSQNLRVAVLAVDPSSPFSMGAVLGDRIRYQNHFNDPNVFIRSVGSRGTLGGLSASGFLMARVFDHAKFDVLLIETVGVGQTELEIMNVADYVAVVVVPEFGDSIQAMKAGILEIANVFVVNKSDRPGAEVIASELESWSKEIGVPVLKTVATQSQGVADLARLLLDSKTDKSFAQKRISPEKIRAEARALLRMNCEKRISKQVREISTPSDLKSLLK